jgi:hypothetical protein
MDGWMDIDCLIDRLIDGWMDANCLMDRLIIILIAI